ncbi:type VI secretion protein [Faecalispora anaeroviscerum]|uniref:type VI secretion protein n=1 Tax=Faecalispora anaeroviscerum TaxID=2991836 RepID=UPI0024BA5906|nr:type VI secretion protein [Faecalispora anaeroviscerum]
MDNAEMLRKMRAGRFVENNGKVLRTINILRHKYEQLKDVKYALDMEMSETEYLDCINYLAEAGYIALRDISTKSPANIADADYTRLEAKVTALGIQLLGGAIDDKMIKA